MFFKPKFKVGDKVRLTTTYYWETGGTRCKAGTTFIITEILPSYRPLIPRGSARTLRAYTCYSCNRVPWVPPYHLKLIKQPIHLTKSTTAPKTSLLTRLTNWLLH